MQFLSRNLAFYVQHGQLFFRVLLMCRYAGIQFFEKWMHVYHNISTCVCGFSAYPLHLLHIVFFTSSFSLYYIPVTFLQSVRSQNSLRQLTAQGNELKFNESYVLFFCLLSRVNLKRERTDWNVRSPRLNFLQPRSFSFRIFASVHPIWYRTNRYFQLNL